MDFLGKKSSLNLDPNKIEKLKGNNDSKKDTKGNMIYYLIRMLGPPVAHSWHARPTGALGLGPMDLGLAHGSWVHLMWARVHKITMKTPIR